MYLFDNFCIFGHPRLPGLVHATCLRLQKVSARYASHHQGPPPPQPALGAGRRAKPPKPSFRPSRRPNPSPWGLGAPTSPSERPSEAREPPISPSGPPAAPPASGRPICPFNGHIKRAVGVGWSGRVPLHPGRLGWGGGGQNRAKNGLV